MRRDINNTSIAALRRRGARPPARPHWAPRRSGLLARRTHLGGKPSGDGAARRYETGRTGAAALLGAVLLCIGRRDKGGGCWVSAEGSSASREAEDAPPPPVRNRERRVTWNAEWEKGRKEIRQRKEVT